MMGPDCRSGQSVKLTFLSKLSLIIAMVGDWGEPVDKEELDNNIKEDILIGIFCQKDFFCPTDILFQHFSTRRHSYPNYGSRDILSHFHFKAPDNPQCVDPRPK